LAPDYFEALKKLPKLVGAAAVHEWDADFLAAAMSALAVGKGFSDVAEAALELRPDIAEEFLKWFAER
jgi:DNA-binding phage protein